MLSIFVFYIFYADIKELKKSRELLIDYRLSTISYDNRAKNLSDIVEVKAIKYNDRLRTKIYDRNAPGNIRSTSSIYIFETYIIFNDDSAIRIFFGSKKRALYQRERFMKYSNLS